MIFTDRTITVYKGESRIDEPIVVYRGDYELEVRFTILNSGFKFMSGTNMIESEKASYGQLAILAPYGGNIFSDIVKCNDGSVTFVLTADMLNQIEEVGLYSFQIRLMDYNKESRVSIPPIEFGIEVREPIASEDHDNSVNNAIVGYSIAKVVDPKKEIVDDTFDEDGNYNKTKWRTGDRISQGKLNKIEDAIDTINENNQSDHFTLNKKISSNYSILNANKADINYVDEVVAKAQMEAASVDTSVLVFKSDYEPVAEFIKGTRIMSNNIGEPSVRQIDGETVIKEYVDVDDYKYVSLTNSGDSSYGIMMYILDDIRDIERITIHVTLHEGNSLRVGVSGADFNWNYMRFETYRDYEDHMFSFTPDEVPEYNPNVSQYYTLFVGADLWSSSFKASFKIEYTFKSKYKIGADEANKAAYADEAGIAICADKAAYTDEARTAICAGINLIKSEYITMNSDKMIKTKIDTVTYNIRKEANVDLNTRLATVYIRIDCPNGITDLNSIFDLGLKRINTENVINIRTFISVSNGDWNPVYAPIFFDGNEVNLYEIIMNSGDYADKYTNVDHVFVVIGAEYDSNQVLADNSLEFEIAPMMRIDDAYVLANALTTECRENVLDYSFNNIRDNIHKIPIGVKRSKLEDYNLRDTVSGIVLSKTDDGWIKCKKESTSVVSQYAGVYVKIEYDNIDDLDGILSVRSRNNQGEDINTRLIMPRIGDWGPGNTGLIGINENSDFNLKEKLLTCVDFEYTNAHVLYVALLYYDPYGVSFAYDYDFKIDFTSINQEVIKANALSDNLKNKITEEACQQIAQRIHDIPIGIRYTDISDYIIRVNTNNLAELTDLGDGWVKCRKEDNAPFSLYAGAYARFDYPDFDSLDGNMMIEVKNLNGPAIENIKILYGVSDWGNGSTEGTIMVPSGTSFNLKEILDRDDRSYKDRNHFYVCMVAYDSYGISSPFEYDYRITFTPNNRKPLIATGLTDSAIDELKESFVGRTTDNYITCWGDSLTAGGGWTQTLSKLSGLPVYNGGTGGENVRTIVARQGGDVMMINSLTIPADITPIVIATRAEGGIPTQLGRKVSPLLQGGAHVNPCYIGDVRGILSWTGSGHSDASGTWTFTRDVAGEEVIITRPTAIRTDFDINRNAPKIMVIFIGQNGGYDDVEDLINQHRLMIEHSNCEDFVVLGLSSGSAESRADYEAAMKKEFGRRFISLREYLSTPIYNSSGDIISCYGLDDAGLAMDTNAKTEISSGIVPHQLLSDSVHYTTETKTVIGNLVYKRIKELGMLD